MRATTEKKKPKEPPIKISQGEDKTIPDFGARLLEQALECVWKANKFQDSLIPGPQKGQNDTWIRYNLLQVIMDRKIFDKVIDQTSKIKLGLKSA